MSITAQQPGTPENSYYPSPFLDIGSQYHPRSLDELYAQCAWHAQYSGPVATTMRKLAAYAITKLSFVSQDADDGSRYTDLAERMGMRQVMVGLNLDRYCYGVSYALARRSFVKVLKCSKCGTIKKAKKCRYTWRDFKFHLKCDSCDHYGPATAIDRFGKHENDLKIVRLNPRQVITQRDPYTQERRHFYKIPRALITKVKSGLRTEIEKLPNVYLSAIKHGRMLLLRKDRLFVFERTAISSSDKVFGDGAAGVPLMAPVLQDLFFIRILMKSQEAVAFEHIVPMRVVFPMVTNPGNDIYRLGSLATWQKEITGQVEKWRRDPNRVVVTGFPLGYQQVGGSGRAMLMHQDIRLYMENVISGMGVPSSFYFGDAHYTGASVNMRSLEQEFLGNRIEMKQFAQFFADQVCSITSWQPATPKFAPFRMADDVQRSAFEFQLVGARVVSRQTFCEKNGYNYDEELERIKAEMEEVGELNMIEAEANAQAQAKAQTIMAKAQMQMQQAAGPEQQAGPPQGPPPGPAPGPMAGPPPNQVTAPDTSGAGINPQDTENLRALVQDLMNIPNAEERERIIADLESKDPAVGTMVRREVELITRAQAA